MSKQPIEQCKDAIKWLLKSIEPKTLFEFAKENKVEIGSFRMQQDSFKKPPVLVKIASELRQSENRLTSLLRDPSMPWHHYIELLRTLDEDWLVEKVDELFEAFADRHFLVALAGDYRPKVANLANSYWQDPEVWSKDPIPNKESELFSLFSPFLPQDLPTKTAKIDTQEIGQLKERIEKERQKHKILIAEKKQEAKGAKDTIQELKESHLKKLTIEKEKVLSLEAEVSKWKNELESRVTDAINRYKENVLNFPTRDEEQKLDRTLFASTESLLREVNAQLDHHAARNKRYGTYSRVRQQIVSLEKALMKTKHCLKESIFVDDKLIQLQKELQTQIQTLKSLPKIRENYEKDTNQYTELIESLPPVNKSLKRLADLERIFQNPEISLLFGTKPEGIKKLIYKKKEYIKTINTEKSTTQVINHSHENRDDTNVQKMLDTHHRLYCIIDGCNLTLSHSFKCGFEDLNLPKSRNQLTNDCQKVQQNWEQIEIVYDSQSESTNISSEGKIKIVFVEKLSEDQNADNYIIRRLKAMNQMKIPPNQICVVTGDRDLQIRAFPYCKHLISPEIFTQYLLSQKSL
jgi:hypothetical protein